MSSSCVVKVVVIVVAVVVVVAVIVRGRGCDSCRGCRRQRSRLRGCLRREKLAAREATEDETTTTTIISYIVMTSDHAEAEEDMPQRHLQE